jgi:hypothetical protein
VKRRISFGGQSKTNGVGRSLKVLFSYTITQSTHSARTNTLIKFQLGDFRPPFLQFRPGTKRLPSVLQDESLVSYPALPLQRRAHGWSQQLAA